MFKLALALSLAIAPAAASTSFYGLSVLPLNTTLAQADVSYLEDGQLAVASSSPVYMLVYDNSSATIGGLELGVSSDSFPVIGSSVGTGQWSVRTLDAEPYTDVSVVIYDGVFQFWVCENAQGVPYGSTGSSFPLGVGRSAPAGCLNPQAVYLQANDYTGYFNSLSSQYAAASTSLAFSYSLTGVYSATATAANINSIGLETDAVAATTSLSASGSATDSASAAESTSSDPSLSESASSQAIYASQTSATVENTTNFANAFSPQMALPALLAFVL